MTFSSAAVRLFGGSGGVSPKTVYTSANFGNDLSGYPVTSSATYSQAVSGLRSPGAHNPPASSNWPNPVRFAVYDTALAASTSTSATGNSVTAVVAALQANGLEPLLVQWTTCGQFAYTSYDSTNSTYWAERWELYRHQYALARWAWLHSVRRPIFLFEFAYPTAGSSPHEA